ncbi:hypothetical protein MKW98_012499 [Papaver atlanticum]|uniref:Pentatricopeptide repeat-containing protein n=1 Tax=Papaver atlanticum TaxID=357466 RepID=A0AAD4SEJ2_9MAGN|nr:hypothetical protein MKW98_012499 [Papaver atlanticum]
MALNLSNTWFPSPPLYCHPSPRISKIPTCKYLCFSIHSTTSTRSYNIRVKSSSSSSSDKGNEIPEELDMNLLGDELINRILSMKDADEVLEMISEKYQKDTGVVGTSDCCMIINSALERGNFLLALSIFSAMRSSFEQDSSIKDWKWSRPDVRTYASLVRGLAASLRVSDAIRMVNEVCRVGVSSGEEVPFGKVVRCPSCTIAVAVAQPQHGSQIASCAKCRYQYELVSGDIVSIESEEVSMDTSSWERGLRFLQLTRKNIPAAVHSIVVQTPTGTARTHRFATKTVELPAREGERVTISLAAPSSVYRQVGPLKFTTKAPGFNPGEPMCLTNHNDGRESELLRAPSKNERLSLLSPSVLFPVLGVLATGDAASGIINPSLPQFISVAAVASVALGTTLNTLVLPQLNRLPQRSVDVVAIKQQLLSQYDILQTRIKNLREATEKEIWMLARMCQLENKILAVGEPSYRARRNRVKRVRESLENSLKGRIELIDSYARISSMIEIEVELDSDVIAAEAVSNAENIVEQIEQTMELENLEQGWREQVEANDEVERLLSSQPMPTEQIGGL